MESNKTFRRNHDSGRHQKLYFQGRSVLKKQFERGKGRSRYKDKKNSGHAQYDKIYSSSSYQKHKSAFNVFVEWAKKEDIHNFWKVQPDDIKRFLVEQEDLGKSYKTVTGYQTAINHIFRGSGRVDHEYYSAAKLGIKGNRERQNNLLNRDDRPAIPSKYDAQVDLITVTGLRRSEAERVGTKSFYRLRDDYYVPTIGKGGRPRITKVLDRGKESFRQVYSDYIIRVESKSDIPQTKKEIQDIYRTQKELYTDKIPTKYGLHIYRAEYAQELYQELRENSKYSFEGVQFEVNGFEGDRGLFREVSRKLGHNRVDVELMGAYFRNK